MNGLAVNEVVNGCISNLDGRIPYFKLALYFSEEQRVWFMILAAGIYVVAINGTASKAVTISGLQVDCSHRWCMVEVEEIFQQKRQL